MTGTRRQDILQMLASVRRMLEAEFQMCDRAQPPVDNALKTEEQLRDRIAELEELLGVRLPLVDINRRWLKLSRHEASVLSMLTSSPGKVLSREFMFRSIYGSRLEADQPDPDIIDQYLVTLRQKLRSYQITIASQWGDGWYVTRENAERLQKILRE